MNTKFTRREFAHLSGAVAVGAVLAACSGTPTATPVPAKPTAALPAAAAATPRTFNQSVAEAMAAVPSITPGRSAPAHGQ